MDENDIIVSSEELQKFKDKLLKLSKVLKECYETISRGLTTLGETWQDPKYEKFVEDFKTSKEKIRTIGEQYELWANGHLSRKIDEAIDYELAC
jgi:hypothetical protein